MTDRESSVQQAMSQNLDHARISRLNQERIRQSAYWSLYRAFHEDDPREEQVRRDTLQTVGAEIERMRRELDN